MVQVDVFWSYGIGASFALGAFRQLRRLQAEKGAAEEDFGFREMVDVRRMAAQIENGHSPAFSNQYFMKTLLFLSLLFVPSGANLLWSNPNWETMQVGRYETIPAWLVGAFSITNVTQGIIGYWVTWNYLMRGKYLKAAMQTIGAYLGFWFILVNGWDKAGYRRFFSRDREAFENWRWTNFFGWLRSDVVRILLAYGVFFIPLMLFWVSKWLMEGFEMDPQVEVPDDPAARTAEMLKTDGYLLGAVFGVGLGGAVAAHLLVRRFGWTKGLAVFSALAYGIGLREKGLGAWLLKKIIRVDSLEGAPVWELAHGGPEKEEVLTGA